MIGSIIGGALKIGGSIFGGIKASQAMKKMKRNIEAQRKSNQAWYDRRFNEDATQRAEAQRMLTKTNDFIKNRNKAASGAQAVTGASEESVAATKAANNQVMADAASQIAAAGDQRKDVIEQQYRETDGQLQGQLNNLEANKANHIVQAVQGVADAGSGIADALGTTETGIGKTKISAPGPSTSEAMFDPQVKEAPDPLSLPNQPKAPTF